MARNMLQAGCSVKRAMAKPEVKDLFNELRHFAGSSGSPASRPAMRQLFRVTLRLSAIPVILSLALAMPLAPAPVAQETFLIPKDDGYGVAECMSAGAACARTVADAWCAAMGRGPSVSFGSTEDETASIGLVSAGQKPSGFRVTCG
jgi:hypothetical protein